MTLFSPGHGRVWSARSDGRYPVPVALPLLNAVLVTICLFFLSLYLTSSDGIFDATGYVVGRDFINLWSAGTFLASGHLADIFNYATYQPLQAQLFGRELPPHYWSYPPPVLFLAAPLAVLPYTSALALWSLLTLAAYLAAVRRPVLLLAPATFMNIFFGQTGCLVAALLIGGFGMRERRPVLAGVLFGLASVKPQLGLLVPLALVAARAWHTVASAAVTVVVLFGLSGVVFGWEAWLAYYEVTVPAQTALLERGTGLFTLMMPSAFMAGRLLGLSAHDAYLVQLPFTLLGAGATWWAFRGSGPEATPPVILLLSTALATPYILAYDLVLISPAVLVMLQDGRSGRLGAGELSVWLLVWILPLILTGLNALGWPVGCLVLSSALGFAVVRLGRQRAALRAAHGGLGEPTDDGSLRFGNRTPGDCRPRAQSRRGRYP